MSNYQMTLEEFFRIRTYSQNIITEKTIALYPLIKITVEKETECGTFVHLRTIGHTDQGDAEIRILIKDNIIEVVNDRNNLDTAY